MTFAKGSQITAMNTVTVSVDQASVADDGGATVSLDAQQQRIADMCKPYYEAMQQFAI